jgi:hypothetical protein
LLVGDVGGHRNQIVRRDDGVLSPVAAFVVKYRYALAAGKILGSWAEGVDDADSLESGRGRELRLDPGIAPADVEQVGRVDRCRQHADARLVPGRFWNRPILDRKDLSRIAVLPEENRFHSFCRATLQFRRGFWLPHRTACPMSRKAKQRA